MKFHLTKQNKTMQRPRGPLLLAGISALLIIIPLVITGVVLQRYVLQSIASTEEIVLLSKEILPVSIDSRMAQRVISYFSTKQEPAPMETLQTNPFKPLSPTSQSPQLE
jgi:hypothetical protein